MVIWKGEDTLKNRERERLKMPLMSWRAVADGFYRYRRAYDVILSASAKRKEKKRQ